MQVTCINLYRYIIKKEVKVMSVVSLIFGIVSLVLCWFPGINWIALVLSILGIVFGAIGMSKAKKAGKGAGAATAGLVLSIIATVFGGIFFFACGGCAVCAAMFA